MKLLLMIFLFSEIIIQPNIAKVAPDIIKQAHKYHGIKYSQSDQFGFHYFYRDKKRCRLLNRRFLNHLKGD